jgi:hypothetical protein
MASKFDNHNGNTMYRTNSNKLKLDKLISDKEKVRKIEVSKEIESNVIKENVDDIVFEEVYKENLDNDDHTRIKKSLLELVKIKRRK